MKRLALEEIIKTIVFACDHDIPVRIQFEGGDIGPHEKILKFNPEYFTMIVSAEQARQEDLKPGDKLGCCWDDVLSVALLND